MEKIIFKDDQRYIDLYYNDVFGLKESLKSIKQKLNHALSFEEDN